MRLEGITTDPPEIKEHKIIFYAKDPYNDI
jgi:hypothetical protein